MFPMLHVHMLLPGAVAEFPGLSSQGAPSQLMGGTEVTNLKPVGSQRLVASKVCYLVLSATQDCLQIRLGCQGALHVPVRIILWLI